VEVKELGHLVLYVRSLEASVHFYRDVLGWRPIDQGTNPLRFPAQAFNAPSGRTHHELLLIEVGEQALPIPRGLRVGMNCALRCRRCSIMRCRSSAPPITA